MEMIYKNLLFKKENKIAVVTINRPDKLNALNNETLNELEDCFTAIKNDENIFVVIITGAGEKAFVAGADISELNELNKSTGKIFSKKGQAIFNLMENIGKPVIAAVNGYALGGGFELALACHIRFASENSKFALPEVNLGIIPGYGGTQRLLRLTNSGIAAEMILAGGQIDANEAFRLGIVNKIFPFDKLLESTIGFAEKITSKSRLAVQSALDTILTGSSVSLDKGLEIESDLFGFCCGTEDFKEGTSAFLEKRKPNFKNK